MVFRPAQNRVGLVGVLPKVLHPEGGCVANVALFEHEARNADIAEPVATTSVELRHLDLLLRD